MNSEDPVSLEYLINEPSKAEKEKAKKAKKFPRYKQYCFPQNRICKYVLIL